MNRIFIIVFLLIGFSASSQTVNIIAEQYRYKNKVAVGTQTLTSNPTDAWLMVGDSNTTKAMIIPRVADTNAIVNPRMGMIVYSIVDHSMYTRNLTSWVKSGVQSIRCGLTCNSCGLVTWTGTGLNFYVSAATYNLSGVSYSFAGDSITLDAADATFDRFDAIVLTSGGVAVVTGEASASPQLPQFDPCDTILLTNILVAASATTPTQVSDEVVYDEDAEWTHTQSGVVSVNFASTAEAIHGTKSTRVATWGNNANLIFTEGGSVPVNSFSTFSFWIRLFVAFTGNQNLSVQFFNGTSAVSNQVPIIFNKSAINVWQGITLSPSQFTFTSSTFTAIRFILGGNGVSTFYLDWVRLQSGITQPSPPATIANAYNRMTDGTNTSIATGGDVFKFRAALPLRNTVTNNDATHGDNVLHSVDTSVAYVPSLTTNARLLKVADSIRALGSTPTLQQVLDAGSTLTSSEIINTSTNVLTLIGDGDGIGAFQVGSSLGAIYGQGDVIGVTGASSVTPIQGINTNSSTNTVRSGLSLKRAGYSTSGAAGVGVAIDYNINNSANNSILVGKIAAKYTTITAGSEVAQFFSTGISNGVTDTLSTFGGYVTLTESSATKFTSTTIATGKIQGGSILVTIESNDATDYQSRTLRFIWSAVNKAGTLTITISTPEEVVAVSSGTLTCTITAVDAGSGVLDFKANAVSSLTQTTLRATYQTFKNF